MMERSLRFLTVLSFGKAQLNPDCGVNCHFLPVTTISDTAKADRLAEMCRTQYSGQLYIDSDGVERGYYVYVHRQRDTGEVFYVGMGRGKRAWDRWSRHKRWHEKVATLGNNWDIVIVKDRLSQLEAFDLERHLVAKYGGGLYDAGTLANYLPGGAGQQPMAFTVPISTAGQHWRATYEQSRKFKEPKRSDQEQIVQGLHGRLETVVARLDELRDAFEDDEALEDSITDLDCILGSPIDCIKDFLRRRISWQDVALSLEEMLGDLDAEDIEELHEKVKPLASEAVAFTAGIFRCIDSGNRLEAESLADRAAKQVEIDPCNPDNESL